MIFKAVITVNLTSMLVLTTMFINVSNSLPKTSYMKMVDAWLLFNLLYPFIVVLLHTYMDTLRSDDDREINHHGKTITINNDEDESPNTIKVSASYVKVIRDKIFVKVKPANLVSVNEKEELEAQRAFYSKIESEMSIKRTRKVERLSRINLFYLPIICLSFVIIFWVVGLKNAEIL